MIENYKFKLYIVEATPASRALVDRMKTVLDGALKDNYTLEIVNILKNPEIAVKEKILASPTLVMELPPPPQRIVGNIKDEKDLLISLKIFDQEEGKN